VTRRPKAVETERKTRTRADPRASIKLEFSRSSRSGHSGFARTRRNVDRCRQTAPPLPYSVLNAAIGSSAAACFAGYTPNARPTAAQVNVASRIGIGAHATCQPASHAIR
jgi:hypothetical protein